MPASSRLHFPYASRRVGICMNNPLYTLDVGGTGRFSSNLNVDGQTFFSNNVWMQGTSVLTTNSINPSVDNQFSIGNTAFRYTSVASVNGTLVTSDSKLKDSQPLTYGLNELLQVETIKYKWNNLKDDDVTKDYQYYGCKADQLKNIFPELVYDEVPDTPLQMNYSELIPVCINAIKELSETVKQLSEKIRILEEKANT
jgi:hypothetical protein